MHLDGFSCIYSDLIICSISVLQPQVIVLDLQVQIWKKELRSPKKSSSDIGKGFHSTADDAKYEAVLSRNIFGYYTAFSPSP